MEDSNWDFNAMTDDNRISSNLLQDVFFANLCSNMFAGRASEESLDVAKEVAEKFMEQQIDGLAITEDEKESNASAKLKTKQ